MKKIITLLSVVVLTTAIWAQSPEKMSYQAVIRDAGNTLVASQTVGMRISILQGSITGTPVFVETQTPITNINGLASLEIGTGILVSGDFAAIDWGNNSYFIKTETDPTGGATYTISGTSQFMSVPYALHARTAENLTDGTSSGEMMYWNGTGWVPVIPTGNEGATLQMIGGVPTWTGGTPPTAVGDYRDGGIVFWVDPTDNNHGLVVDMNDLSTSAQWGCLNTIIAGADNNAIGTGAQNTIDIEAGCPTPGTAADLCANSTNGGYSDWFLPSIDALSEIYTNLSTINNSLTTNGGSSIDIAWYWSSTEQSSTLAFEIYFGYGLTQGEVKSWSTVQVRGVRAF